MGSTDSLSAHKLFLTWIHLKSITWLLVEGDLGINEKL
jgi:hypothetical protein